MAALTAMFTLIARLIDETIRLIARAGKNPVFVR